MSWPSPAELPYAVLGLLPTAAVAAAEGALVAVVYDALVIGREAPDAPLGLWAFMAAAALGLLVVRRTRGAVRGPAVVMTVAVAGGLGWLSDSAVPRLLGDGAVGVALLGHGVGLLLAVAAWRGTRHARAAEDDLVTGSVLAWGLPGLALPWLVGGLGDARAAFVATALPGTLVFAAAGLVAVGLTRLQALGESVGVDWRTNRVWLMLLGGVAALVAVVGGAAAVLLDSPVDRIIRALLGPLGPLVDGVDGAAGTFSAQGLGALDQLLQRPPASPSAVVAGPAGSGVAGPPDIILPLVAALLLAGGVWFVWRRVRGTTRTAAPWRPPAIEERRLIRPVWHIPRPAWPVRLAGPARRQARPATASQAYLALLRAWARDSRTRRAPGETPAAHARRLRAQGDGDLGGDLLAADFVLERYAAVRLTQAELRRALRRGARGHS